VRIAPAISSTISSLAVTASGLKTLRRLPVLNVPTGYVSVRSCVTAPKLYGTFWLIVNAASPSDTLPSSAVARPAVIASPKPIDASSFTPLCRWSNVSTCRPR
jgi:hypothetical protein